jgi:hypothetical protein
MARWPQAARRLQAARWALCTYIDIHFFSGRQKTSSSISIFGQVLIANWACDYLNTQKKSDRILKMVNGLPVDYPLRFSGPVTPSPPAASGMVEPDLICQPDPTPGIKTHSSPAAFPTTLSLHFVPLTFQLPAPPHPVVPQAAPSSTYSLRPPLSPQNRYDAASGKNAAA